MTALLPACEDTVPFGRVVQRRKDSGAPDLDPLSVYLESGVVPRSTRDDNHNRLGADLSNYLVVQPGDIVFNKLRTWQGGLGVSRYRGIVSPAYFVCRPSPDFEPRFLHYLLRSAPYLAEFSRISKFMPPSQFDIAWEDLRLVPVPATPLEHQRAIANFLDTETARIDALITKKRRMIDLLQERVTSAAGDLLGDVPTVVLRRVADTLAGYSFPSETFGPDMPGPRLLRGVNVAPGSVRWDDCVRLAHEGTDLARYGLLTGDVVLGMDRPFVGGGTRVATVGSSSAGALLVQRVCRIRAQSQDHAVVLRWALGSPEFRRHVEADLTGVSVPHLSEEQISSFRVPDVGVDQAAEIAERIRVVEAQDQELRNRLLRQVTLLQEHRQALITAAVTGELEVPGVAA